MGLTARGKMIRERHKRLRDTHPRNRVRVVPKNDGIRSFLIHPVGVTTPVNTSSHLLIVDARRRVFSDKGRWCHKRLCGRRTTVVGRGCR
jgi:hypothetical protein